MVGSLRRSLLAALFVLSCVLCSGAAFAQASDAVPADVEVRNSLRQMAEIYSIIEQNYAEPVNADKAFYSGAIPSMLHVLDPHSNFFDRKAYSAMREEQQGRYYGVGMQIAPRNNRIIVLAPFVGTPAYRSGIKPGDTIISVEGKVTDNLPVSEVVNLLKGPKGSTVHISILRDSSEKALEFAVVRDEIPRNSVDLKFQIGPGVGYMHVTAFNETTGREVKAALEEFGDLKGLILDLRGNPGGLLNEAVSVTDKFLKRGQVIVSQHGRRSPERVFRATHGNGGKEYPLVVLVNRGTASAAEIVSGAIQDHDRGLIVGETTFGKGLVQLIYPLAQNTALTLTIARYYTPSGRLIQREYAGLSLYDYYYNHEQEEALRKEPRLTDLGRTVYGGDGIAPDVKVPALKSNRFQDSLLQHYAFFNFAHQYLARHPADRSFQVSSDVLQEFRKFLTDEKLTFSEMQLAERSDWVKAQIKAEVFISQFGQEEGMKVRAETDPQVMAALKLLPKARELAEKASKVVAQKATPAVPAAR
ncbi:MAG TPA: S41 family peptidase [Candidatus Saccharimonadales bacterium]|jgi:carboxyl-terminal processing protease|nr:S41 family peptidase [Candidatus Saccharimonadales bacterium]